MPRCKGLSDGPCPLKQNDSSVVIGNGDLILRVAYDTERRRLFNKTSKTKTTWSSEKADAESCLDLGDMASKRRGKIQNAKKKNASVSRLTDSSSHHRHQRLVADDDADIDEHTSCPCCSDIIYDLANYLHKRSYWRHKSF